MIHKQFQHNTDKGGIDVQFNLEFDGTNVNVSNIQIHGTFNTGLPHSASLENYQGRWVLGARYKRKENGININTLEYLNGELSKEIASKIVKIKEEETPKFIN